jgi:Na+/H+-dicarboxylate symporter
MHTKYFMKVLHAYFFPIILIFSLVMGGLFGFFFQHQAIQFKFLGEIFLNLIFTTIVPLIFFSVSVALPKMGSWQKIGKIFSSMLFTFVLMGSVASLLMLALVKHLPLLHEIQVPMDLSFAKPIILTDKLVQIFTVPDFLKLFSHQNIFALIIFSLLVGGASFDQPKFVNFLQEGEQVFMKVFALVMYFAPIGFFAYFAATVAELGPQIMQNYLQIGLLYYAFALVYFVIIYSLWVYIAGGREILSYYWRNIFLPATMALATCSSAASIPANLRATKNMQTPTEIAESVIPLGTMIHKDGSIIGGIIKIVFLFSVFHVDFNGLSVYALAWLVSLMVGTVMGAIPSGGMLGELLILSAYGYPSSALIVIAAISIIIDPMATMLNVTGNSVSALLVSRMVYGKNWFKGINQDERSV